MTTKQQHSQEVKEQQKETLKKGLIPVMLFLIAQAGYLIFWMARVETTLMFALAVQKEIREELRVTYVDKYTGAQARDEKIRVNERFKRYEETLTSFDSRLRKIETQR